LIYKTDGVILTLFPSKVNEISQKLTFFCRKRLPFQKKSENLLKESAFPLQKGTFIL